MQLSDLTPEQIRTYFDARLPDLPSGEGEVNCRCPFHEDSKPSFGVDLSRGFWICHAGCGGGMMLEFEKRISGTEDRAALQAIASLLGEDMLPLYPQPKGETIYQYLDEHDRLLFEVIKRIEPNGKKRFLQRRKGPDGKWIYDIKNVRRVLYNLSNVISAKDVVIVEGEKCAERLGDEVAAFLNSVNHSQMPAITCNPGGAGKWLDEYAPFLAGKQVVILPDNDAVGRKHAQMVAASAHKYAAAVKVVTLPDLAEGGDIADFLNTRPLTEFFRALKQTPVWVPPVEDSAMFISAPKFMAMVPEEIDWAVTDLIQRGANGVVAANPKGGKSWFVIDLALALATGTSILGFEIPQRMRVALVSREDGAGLTGHRMRFLQQGRAIHDAELDGYLYVNSRAQTKTLMLDDEQQLEELIRELQKFNAELVFLDVFNILHAANENDNTEMRAVLNQVTRIQNEVGCSICLVHHWSKGRPDDTITQRLRGASAIAGWAEFVFGITTLEKVDNVPVRKMEYELKAAESPEAMHYRIMTNKEARQTKLERMPQSYTPSEPQAGVGGYGKR